MSILYIFNARYSDQASKPDRPFTGPDAYYYQTKKYIRAGEHRAENNKKDQKFKTQKEGERLFMYTERKQNK